MSGPRGRKSAMRGSIRRQGVDSWQVRVYKRTTRRYEYFTVTGELKDARDARNRRLAEIAKGSRPPPPKAGKITIRDLTAEWLDRKRATPRAEDGSAIRVVRQAHPRRALRSRLGPRADHQGRRRPAFR